MSQNYSTWHPLRYKLRSLNREIIPSELNSYIEEGRQFWCQKPLQWCIAKRLFQDMILAIICTANDLEFVLRKFL